MSFKRPSPSMVVACIALFVALGGTSIAAVNYARKAGQVDGKNAYKPKRSTKVVAGDLVATTRTGSNAGTIPNKFLADAPKARPFGTYQGVNDNAPGGPVGLADTDLGTFVAACTDEDNRPNIENGEVRFTYNNDTGNTVNFARRVAVQQNEIGAVPPGGSHSFTINGSQMYTLQLESFSTIEDITGFTRQDGSRSNDARCLIVGNAQRVR